MPSQYYSALLIDAQGDGTALTNSTTPTSILPAQAKVTLGNNFFDVVGKRIRVSGFGRISNVVTTPGTLTLDLRFGSTVVANSGAFQMSTTAHTNVSMWFECLATCRVVGASANLMFMWKVTSQAFSLTAAADSTTTIATLLGPSSAPAVGSNFDSTATQQIDMFGTFSVNTATTSIQIHEFGIESLN